MYIPCFSGVQDMSIEIFNCDFLWTPKITTLVPETNHQKCDEIPLHTYPIKEIGRLVKILAWSKYGSFAGLQYINIHYKAKSCAFCGQFPDTTNGVLIQVQPEVLPYRFGKTSIR